MSAQELNPDLVPNDLHIISLPARVSSQPETHKLLERTDIKSCLSTPDSCILTPYSCILTPDACTSPRLYLIRHGETEWSLSGQYTGRTDLLLTAHGEAAARKVGERLKNVSFAHVLTSPLQRARQTCARAALEPTPEIEPNLIEWDNGDYEGCTLAEIREVQPEWNLFRDGAPNGETPVQISDRGDRLLAHLRTFDGNVALFSHGHLCRVLAARWIGLSVEQAAPFLLNTASISILSYAHGCPDEPAIALWNSEADELFNPAPMPNSVAAKGIQNNVKVEIKFTPTNAKPEDKFGCCCGS